MPQNNATTRSPPQKDFFLSYNFYNVLLSFNNCPSLLNNKFFFTRSLLATCILYCTTFPGRYIIVTTLISHSAPAYLLFDKPSFTAGGIASLPIRFVAPSHPPSLLYRAIYLLVSTKK